MDDIMNGLYIAINSYLPPHLLNKVSDLYQKINMMESGPERDFLIEELKKIENQRVLIDCPRHGHPWSRE